MIRARANCFDHGRSDGRSTGIMHYSTLVSSDPDTLRRWLLYPTAAGFRGKIEPEVPDTKLGSRWMRASPAAISPNLGPRRPVCVSSLGTLYAERTHVAQVLVAPLKQGSSISLNPHILAPVTQPGVLCSSLPCFRSYLPKTNKTSVSSVF